MRRKGTECNGYIAGLKGCLNLLSSFAKELLPLLHPFSYALAPANIFDIPGTSSPLLQHCVRLAVEVGTALRPMCVPAEMDIKVSPAPVIRYTVRCETFSVM